MTIAGTNIGAQRKANGWRSAPLRITRRGEAAIEQVTTAVRPMTLPMLRLVLGSLFIWFGLLKVVGTRRSATWWHAPFPGCPVTWWCQPSGRSRSSWASLS